MGQYLQHGTHPPSPLGHSGTTWNVPPVTHTICYAELGRYHCGLQGVMRGHVMGTCDEGTCDEGTCDEGTCDEGTCDEGTCDGNM